MVRRKHTTIRSCVDCGPSLSRCRSRERRCRWRRLQHRARLRHRYREPESEIHPILCTRRTDPGSWRHLVFASASSEMRVHAGCALLAQRFAAPTKAAELGPDLARRGRRGSCVRGDKDLRALRDGADTRSRADQAGSQCIRNELARRTARISSATFSAQPVRRQTMREGVRASWKSAKANFTGRKK